MNTYDPYSIPFLEPKPKKDALPLKLTTKGGSFEFRVDENLPEYVTISGTKAHAEILRLLAAVQALGAQCDKQARRINQLLGEMDDMEKATLAYKTRITPKEG